MMKYFVLTLLLIPQLCFGAVGVGYSPDYRYMSHIDDMTTAPLSFSNVTFIGSSQPVEGAPFTAIVYNTHSDGFPRYIIGDLVRSGTTLTFDDIHSTSYCKNPWTCDLQLNANDNAPNLLTGQVFIKSEPHYKVTTSWADQPEFLFILTGQSNNVCLDGYDANFNRIEAAKDLIPDTKNILVHRRKLPGPATSGAHTWQQYRPGMSLEHVVTHAAWGTSPTVMVALLAATKLGLKTKVLPASHGASAYSAEWDTLTAAEWTAINPASGGWDDVDGYGASFIDITTSIRELLFKDPSLIVAGFFTELGYTDASNSLPKDAFRAFDHTFIERVRNDPKHLGDYTQAAGFGDALSPDFLVTRFASSAQVTGEMAFVPFVHMYQNQSGGTGANINTAIDEADISHYYYSSQTNAPGGVTYSTFDGGIHWDTRNCTEMGRHAYRAWLDAYTDKPDQRFVFDIPDDTTTANTQLSKSLPSVNFYSLYTQSKVAPLPVWVDGGQLRIERATNPGVWSAWSSFRDVLYNGDSLEVKQTAPATPGESNTMLITIGDYQDTYKLTAN